MPNPKIGELYLITSVVIACISLIGTHPSLAQNSQDDSAKLNDSDLLLDALKSEGQVSNHFVITDKAGPGELNLIYHQFDFKFNNKTCTLSYGTTIGGDGHSFTADSIDLKKISSERLLSAAEERMEYFASKGEPDTFVVTRIPTYVLLVRLETAERQEYKLYFRDKDDGLKIATAISHIAQICKANSQHH